MLLLADILPKSLGPYLVLMLAGFVVGVAGHLFRSRFTVGIGIAMVFLATLLLPLAIIATDDAPPQRDVIPPGYR